MEKVAEFKILIFLVAIGSSLQAGKFENFQSCILNGGVVTGRIVQRNTDFQKYNELNYHWQLKPPNIHPLAFVVATSENDVVTTVTCGKKNGVRVVARSGGHSFEKYSFGDSESVVLDLRNLRTIVLNNSTGSVVIGAGALAGTVIMTLWNSARVFFPVGTCPTVGISGLATGGGYGFTSRRYGLTTDFILAARIVTADGRRLVVNDATNSDLYWALRGGGAASFGVVTSLTMKVIPAPPTLFGVTVTWSLNQFVKVFNAWQNFTTGGEFRTITAKMNTDNREIQILLIDLTGTDTNFEKLFKNFPPPNSISRKSLSFPDYLVTIAGNDLRTAPDGSQIDPEQLLTLERTWSPQTYQIEKSFFIQTIASDAGIILLEAFLRQMPSIMHVSFQAFGGAIADVDIRHTAFVHRNGTFALATVRNLGMPQNVVEVNSIYFWTEEFFKFGALIFDHKESYQNYVDRKLKDYLDRYYGVNLRRLIRVKQKYDPDDYFHNPQSIPAKNLTVDL